MASNPLFTIPILASPSGPSSGTFVCTENSPGVYLLTFTAAPDNRLTTSFVQAFLLALDILEFSYPHGVVVTTSGIQKFYSNGLDLEHASSTKGFFANSLFALFKRLLTYPMPTVALINGHAFAGGFMVAMSHDYRIFNPTRGFLCLNELILGVPLRAPMSSIFRQKLVPKVYREMVLEAKRFSGQEALEKGIVDGLGGWEEVTKLIQSGSLLEAPKTGVYSELKREMYRETLAYIDGNLEEEERLMKAAQKETERVAEAEARVKEWKLNTKGPKL